MRARDGALRSDLLRHCRGSCICLDARTLAGSVGGAWFPNRVAGGAMVVPFARALVGVAMSAGLLNLLRCARAQVDQ